MIYTVGLLGILLSPNKDDLTIARTGYLPAADVIPYSADCSLDLMFLFDRSSSMGDNITDSVSVARSLVEKLDDEGTDAYVGMVSFGYQDRYPHQELPLQPLSYHVASQFSSVIPLSGKIERIPDALLVGSNESWRENSYRMMVLFTDEFAQVHELDMLQFMIESYLPRMQIDLYAAVSQDIENEYAMWSYYLLDKTYPLQESYHPLMGTIEDVIGACNQVGPLVETDENTNIFI